MIPLYCVAMVCAFLAARFGTNGLLPPVRRCLRPLLQHVPQLDRPVGRSSPMVLVGIAVMLVHTYYGYGNRWSGGVGAAVGRSVHLADRPGLCCCWPSRCRLRQSGNFHLSG